MQRLILLCLFVIAGKAMAQGNVEIIRDPRIDALVRQEGAIVPPATAPQLNGYRIQLFFDASKENVDAARAKFVNLYPKVDTYLTFTAPNYFLKVGDFRTQTEAEKVKSGIEGLFPTSFIVREKINLPRVDQ